MINLFVEDIGEKSAPPVLYLHGGPGTGSYEFVQYQRELLSDHVRLIAIDQRGVLRSPAIGKDENFGLNDLVEDIVNVRRSLCISSWSVLGHSFGGYLGVLYANAYPATVERLIFENATFDLGLSVRSLLQGAALEYAMLGNREIARVCLNLAFVSSDKLVSELWSEFTDLTNDLGDSRNHLYVHGIETDFFERLVERSPFSLDDWGKAGMHQQKLFEEGNIFDSLLNSVPSQPTLLLKGKFDYVMSMDQIQAYINGNSNTELVVFENSGHFPHAEEAKKFSIEVIRYIHSGT